MCLDYDPDPELSGALGRAQADADEARPIEQGDPERRLCGLCKRLEDPKRGYQTSAGWICGGCAAYFADEAMR
jgi:hypothetical protein